MKTERDSYLDSMYAYLNTFEEFKRTCRHHENIMNYSEHTIATLWLGYVITKTGEKAIVHEEVKQDVKSKIKLD